MVKISDAAFSINPELCPALPPSTTDIAAIIQAQTPGNFPKGFSTLSELAYLLLLEPLAILFQAHESTPRPTSLSTEMSAILHSKYGDHDYCGYSASSPRPG